MARTRLVSPIAPLAVILAGSISTLGAAPDLRPTAPAPDFMKRMLREARREASRVSDRPPIAGEMGEVEELEFAETRARQAERIFRRSVRGALGDQLEPLLRSLPAFERLLGARDLSIATGASAGAPTVGAAASGPAVPAPAGAMSGSIGFRLDAHPRLLIRGRLYGARGVLELPVLDHEIRLSIDQPLGARGAAVLRGGLSRERGEWVTFSINLSF